MPQKVIAIDMDDKPQSNAMSKKSTTKNKKRWWQKLGTKRGRLIVGGLGLLLMVVAGGLYWYVQSQPESTIARHLPIIPTPTPEVPSIQNLNPAPSHYC